MAILSERDLLRASREDLDRYLELKLHESERLDYKQDLSGDVSQTVAAMANTDGGTIIVGVEEDPKTKTPQRATGFEHRDARGAINSQVFTYLDPAVTLETALIPADGSRAFLVIAVQPSTSRAVLHREKGLLVRVGDQCVAPNRSAFERLLARESASSLDAARRRQAVSGQAGHWNGPGGEGARLRVTVVATPIRPIEAPPSDTLDDTLATIGSELMGMELKPTPEPDRSAAEGFLNPDMPPNRISVARSGDVEIAFCAQPPGWTYPGQPEWMIPAFLLAADVIRCLLVPFAIARASSTLALTPVAVAVAFSGWNKKALSFGHGAPNPRAPFEPRNMQAPVRSGSMAQPSDAFVLAREAVRDLARFYGQRGTDRWAETLAGDLNMIPELAPWMSDLLL